MDECFSHSFVVFYTDHQSAENICSEDDLRSTIMDKSAGTVIQFERFLIHAKLYPHVTNTARPYPLLPPHGQCRNRVGTIPLIFQHCIRWERGRGHAFVK